MELSLNDVTIGIISNWISSTKLLRKSGEKGNLKLVKILICDIMLRFSSFLWRYMTRQETLSNVTWRFLEGIELYL
jgi:hypothetical protein